MRFVSREWSLCRGFNVFEAGLGYRGALHTFGPALNNNNPLLLCLFEMSQMSFQKLQTA